MKKILLLLPALLWAAMVFSQNTFNAILRNKETAEALPGVTAVIKGTTLGGVSDEEGTLIIENIPDGASEELGEIVVEGTRSNRSIGNTPTRVEVLTEEIDEAATMDPSKVAHLLTHSTGIQVQQTSATSNTANVRIQGLDGRYTQILKDGFPLYGGFPAV